MLAATIGATLSLIFRLQRPLLRWLPGLLVALALVGGLYRAVGQASLFDDAYVSLRYAKNMIEGQGLVWNLGERVEGYTNFLWLMMLAGASWISGAELPLVALLACLAAYAATVLVMARVESRLFGSGIPVATLLYALQNTSLDYATSGLETGFSTLCVLLGAYTLTQSYNSSAKAGAWFILGTFCRPDLGIFWVAGGLAWGLRERHKPGLRAGFYAYSATFLPYALYLLWKLSYYGSLLPNTYYAKSANLWYLEQGAIYALSFLLGSHLWLMVPLILRGMVRPGGDPAKQTLAIFSAIAVPTYSFYVLKVGGDFMYGRFFLVLLPCLLLLARAGIPTMLSWQKVAATTLLASTLGGVNIVPEGGKWYISDEARVYPVLRWWPRVEVDHPNWRTGINLHTFLSSRGIRPVIATSGIGMVGYYSELKVIDLLGLTDARIAHMPVAERGIPGHEKRPPRGYLAKRKVQLFRWTEYQPARWLSSTAIDLGVEGQYTSWRFYTYNKDFAHQLQNQAPELQFKPFEPILDRWLSGRHPADAVQLKEDSDFFDQYYFCCNDDPERKAEVAAVLAAADP